MCRAQLPSCRDFGSQLYRKTKSWPSLREPIWRYGLSNHSL
ncbi:hypothetical protein EVA_11588 [gut metagenome]|uniref:Uncharacterized protein n=1 Tax=gut metagenome TaxID=749906 RepID=J9FZ97_9ZZZZ